MGGRKKRSARGRRAFAALAVLATLTAIALLTVPRLVPSDRLAARAAEALAAATGARVTVASASATLVGGPGLRLRGVTLDARPAWQVTLESADVSLAVAPLLRRALVVDRLAGTGPAASAVLAGGRPLALTSFTVEGSGLGLALAPSPDAAGAGAAWPADLGGVVKLRAAGLSSGGFELADVAAEVRPEGRRLVVTSVTSHCAGGGLAADGVVDLGAAPVTWTGALRLTDVEARMLLGEWAPQVAPQLDTRLSGEARGSGVIAGGPAADDAALAALRAEARLDAGPGVIHAGPWLTAAEPYLGDRPDLVDVKLTGGRLAARIADGRCLVDTLALRGPDTDWDLTGALDLVAGPASAGGPALDLAVHLRLPPGFTPQLGAMSFFAAALRDAEGRIRLDLRLRGPQDEPDVTLDLAAMSARLRAK